MGNTTSICRFLQNMNFQVEHANQPSQVNPKSAIVLCGVGSFDEAIKKLRVTGFIDYLTDVLFKKSQTVIGICLGMQILTEGSEEGELPGLGYFPLKVKELKSSPAFPIPHIGWNKVSHIGPYQAFFEEEFYFSHKYAVTETSNVSIGKTEHGQLFCSVIHQGNAFGVQFHPEKSYEAGKKVFNLFLGLSYTHAKEENHSLYTYS